MNPYVDNAPAGRCRINGCSSSARAVFDVDGVKVRICAGCLRVADLEARAWKLADLKPVQAPPVKRTDKPIVDAWSDLTEQAQGDPDTCGYCGRGIIPQPTGGAKHEPNHRTRDHFVPRCKGGTSARSNLWWVCAECNAAKSNAVFESIEAVRAWIASQRMTGALRLAMNYRCRAGAKISKPCKVTSVFLPSGWTCEAEQTGCFCTDAKKMLTVGPLSCMMVFVGGADPSNEPEDGSHADDDGEEREADDGGGGGCGGVLRALPEVGELRDAGDEQRALPLLGHARHAPHDGR